MAKKIKIKVKKPQSLKDFDIAMRHYQSGNLQQAEAVCRQIVQRDAGHADAWHLFGLIAGRLGRHDESVCHINKAIQIKPNVYSYYNNLGLAFRFLKHFDEAIKNFQRAVELKPDFAGALNNLGITFADKGTMDEAIEYFDKALLVKPDYIEARNNLEYILKTVAEKHYNLGNQLSEKGLADQAIEYYQKALKLRPDYVEVYNNLGNILEDRGMIDEAIVNYRKASMLRPGDAMLYFNLGIALQKKGLFDEAMEGYKKALELRPDDADVYNNMGVLLVEIGMIRESLECHERAKMLGQNIPEIHKNIGMTYLLIKDFERGWEEYEWRLQQSKVSPLIKPGWDGSSLERKTILVYPEQGYGDILQFVRYLPKLYEDFGAEKVLFIPQKGLNRLFRESGLKAEILDAATSVESLEYDTNIHLLSLPRIFKTNLENMPFKGKRYLKANPEKVKWYREKFFDLQPATCNLQLKVGIFWQGNPALKPDKRRSMPLHYFYSLCRLPGVKVYSLQKGYGIEQLDNLPVGIEIINLGETFNDFSDTAAAIENLDLVITIDTAVAHLSGALGKKTWILLPSHIEWRWHLDLDYSPWYEDVKLFRHKELGRKDWEEMMERVVEEIRAQGVERKGRGNRG